MECDDHFNKIVANFRRKKSQQTILTPDLRFCLIVAIYCIINLETRKSHRFVIDLRLQRLHENRY